MDFTMGVKHMRNKILMSMSMSIVPEKLAFKSSSWTHKIVEYWAHSFQGVLVQKSIIQIVNIQISKNHPSRGFHSYQTPLRH